MFSKNRACQLELLLRSLNIEVTVIYTCDKGFDLGYEQVIDLYPNVNFVREFNFKDQILAAIGKTPHVMFLVDDDVMLEGFREECAEFALFKSNLSILCLNLRMTPRYRCGDKPILVDNHWAWEQYKHGKTRNWGYPMSTSSHIFRSTDIMPMLVSRNFDTPHTLEKVLRSKAINRPLMLCFENPKFINNSANQVQTAYPFPSLGIPVKELELGFTSGRRLSLSAIRLAASQATDCFMFTPYEWEDGE